MKRQYPSRKEHLLWLTNQEYPYPKKELTNILCCILWSCFLIVLMWSLPIMHWFFKYTMTMHELTQKLYINLLVRWSVLQHILSSAGQRGRMAMSRSVSKHWNKSNLVYLLSSNENDSPHHIHLSINHYNPGLELEPSVPEKTKQQLCDSDCYTSEAFLAGLFCMILDISSLGDNLYMCYNLWSLWSAYGEFCQQGENLYDCASTKKHAHHCLIHCGFIIQLWDICAKFVASERQAGVSTPFFLMLLVGTSIV